MQCCENKTRRTYPILSATTPPIYFVKLFTNIRYAFREVPRMYESKGLILFRLIFSFTLILFLHINSIRYIIECNQQLLNKTSSLSTRCWSPPNDLRHRHVEDLHRQDDSLFHFGLEAFQTSCGGFSHLLASKFIVIRCPLHASTDILFPIYQNSLHTHTHTLVHHPRLVASNDIKRRLDLRKILHFLFDLFPIYPRLMQSNRSEPSVAQQYRETVGRASERKEMGAWVRKIEQRSGENEADSRGKPCECYIIKATLGDGCAR